MSIWKENEGKLAFLGKKAVISKIEEKVGIKLLIFPS
jgi:hypothetical protein